MEVEGFQIACGPAHFERWETALTLIQKQYFLAVQTITEPSPPSTNFTIMNFDKLTFDNVTDTISKWRTPPAPLTFSFLEKHLP